MKIQELAPSLSTPALLADTMYQRRDFPFVLYLVSAKSRVIGAPLQGFSLPRARLRFSPRTPPSDFPILNYAPFFPPGAAASCILLHCF